MDKVIPFEKMQAEKAKEKGEEEKVMRLRADEAGVEKPDASKNPLWDRLDQESQALFSTFLKSVADSPQKRFAVSERVLEDQRRIVRNWPDEKVLEFLADSKNRNELKIKPYLFLALFERVRGKI